MPSLFTMLKSAGRFLLYVHKNEFHQTIFFSEANCSNAKIEGYAHTGDHKVENYLMNIGYYRLSAYIYPFYKSPKSNLVLKEETTFEQVLTLYCFDKKLRILLFNEIEKIEVAIRSVLANIGCQELNDRYWIIKSEYFASADNFSYP